MKSNYPYLAVSMFLVIIAAFSALIVPASAPAELRNYAPKQGNPGLPVNLIGNGFNGLSNIVVRFGNTGAPSVTVKNDQHIQAQVPSIPDGTYVLFVAFIDDTGARNEAIGGFTVGPPLTGLVLSNIFPEEVPSAGGSTIYLLGNGFLSGGRNSSPSVIFQGIDAVERIGATIDDSLIQVQAPSALSLGLSPGDRYTLTVTFSDAKSVSGSFCCVVL